MAASVLSKCQYKDILNVNVRQTATHLNAMRIYIMKNKFQKQPFAAVFSKKVFLSRCFFSKFFFVFFSQVFLVKVKIWRFCQRINYSIFFGLSLEKVEANSLKVTSKLGVFQDESIP